MDYRRPTRKLIGSLSALSDRLSGIEKSLSDGISEIQKDSELESVNAERREFRYDMLSRHDIRYLTEHGMLTDGKISKGLEFYFRGKSHLHIVTDKKSWQTLAGRHWVYDMNTKKLDLIIMN